MEKLKELRTKAMALPLSPGVYLMKNSKNEIIYIGKAKALKNRVSSYFGSQNNHTEKVKRMVENVNDFDYILTDSEFEALILECSLIKQHKPHYNILLKDDKGYSYIRISPPPWSRITEAKQISNDGAEYLGPYYSSYYVKNAVDETRKIFKLPTCNRRFPNEFGKKRPCLNYHIKQCSGVCMGKITEKEYNENFKEAVEFIRCGNKVDLKALEEKMYAASENLEFELAAKIRDRIEAINKLQQKQKVVSVKVSEQDVIAFAGDSDYGCFSVLRFSDSKLYDKKDFLIKDVGELKIAMGEFIEQFYLTDNRIPTHIYIDSEIENKETYEEWLTDKRKKRVYIFTPQRGEQYQLIKMCKNNAFEKLAKSKGGAGKDELALDELSKLLGLDKSPVYIESYDISNLAGESNVAGMIVFKNGKPLKSSYRKFKIKGFEGQNDYASMAEVLDRRLSEYFEKKDDEAFSRLPDLILLDGGKGQVSAVKAVLAKYNLNIPIFGMVKDSKHKTRAITDEGNEIAISGKRSAFTLVSAIQEEVHRFAIGYHRQTRKKKTFGSSLTEIDGIGESRAKALLKYFKTIKRISEADLKELENVPTMTKSAALSVYNHFKKDK